MNVPPVVSICMIVKDEETNLQRCLDSLMPLINWKDDDALFPMAELIIVDTGSSDRTMKIARKFTKRILQKKFIPWDFSNARNYGIRKAKGKWIMVIDADEQLMSQDMAYKLMFYMTDPQWSEFNAIFLNIRNFYNKGLTEFTEMLQPRAFRNNGKDVYTGGIHNRPGAVPPYMFAPDITLNHYGYQFEGKPALFREKNKNRSLPMLEERYNKNPNDLHILTHLVKTLYVIGDNDGVIKYGEEWMLLMREAPYDDGWYAFLEVFVEVCAAYLQRNDPAAAEKVCKEAEKYSKRLVNIYYYLGKYYTVEHPEKAVEYYEKAITITSEDGSYYEMLVSCNLRIIIPEMLNWLAIYYFAKGEFIKAGNCVNEGIRINENRLPLAWDIWNHPEAYKRLIKD